MRKLVVVLLGVYLEAFSVSGQVDRQSVMTKSTEFVWDTCFHQVEIKSPVDGKLQKAYFFSAKTDEAQPLVVSLHTWSGDYSRFDTLAIFCKNKNINYIHPDFRGSNTKGEACCSNLALTDIDASIDYAIAHANVDKSRIYVIGVSGGGYATLSMFMKSRHNIRKFSAWVPISDLIAWYRESKTIKPKYADDILACVGLQHGKLDEKEARKRSPIYWETPVEKLDKSQLCIYVGVNDGIQGSVPITHSINFYNKVLRDLKVIDTTYYVSDNEKKSLLKNRTPLTESGEIGGRKICLYKKHGNVQLTVFEGGHEMLPEFAFNSLISLMPDSMANNQAKAFPGGWAKSTKNPLAIFKGDFDKAVKNCLNSPVVIPIDSCPYKNYKWAFFHLSTHPETFKHFLSVSFATSEGFKNEQWENELEIYGKLVEPFDVHIIDGEIYLWGTWPEGHENANKPFVMTSRNWIDWSRPELTIDTDKDWKSNRVRWFTVGKVPDVDKYVAMYCGQKGTENGPFTIGRAVATKEQLKNNKWIEDSDNPVFTANSISWNRKDVVLYPRLLPFGSNGRWMMAMATYLKKEGLGKGSFSVGFVYSDDTCKHWREYMPGTNPVLLPGPEKWDEGYVSTPYVIETGSRSYKMYYGARPEVMKYDAIGLAYLGNQDEEDDYVFAVDRQVGWPDMTLQNMQVKNEAPYENDLNDELVQKNPNKNCEILTPIFDMGEGKVLSLGKGQTRLFVQNISNIKIEIQGSNEAPSVEPQKEWRKGEKWYKEWGKGRTCRFKKCSVQKGVHLDEFYIIGEVPYRFVQLKISSSAQNVPLILDQIVIKSKP